VVPGVASTIEVACWVSAFKHVLLPAFISPTKPMRRRCSPVEGGALAVADEKEEARSERHGVRKRLRKDDGMERGEGGQHVSERGYL
jgi:hypothetical protein